MVNTKDICNSNLEIPSYFHGTSHKYSDNAFKTDHNRFIILTDSQYGIKFDAIKVSSKKKLLK